MERGTVAQWVGAIITFAAVLVALFKDEFWRLLRRPALKGSIFLLPPDCNKGPIFRQPDGFQQIATISVFGSKTPERRELRQYRYLRQGSRERARTGRTRTWRISIQ
jgi:hypothetical protein